MSDYIDSDDITDEVINQFALTAYITESTNALDDIAEKRGVAADDIDKTTPHWKLKRWAVCYVGMRVAEDRYGVNNNDVALEFDKYFIKFKEYEKKCNDMEPQLTSAMFLDEVSVITDRVNAGRAFRG